jgi:S-adenosylmethionine decarboxylase
MERYKPGLHILASFRAPDEILKDVDSCRSLFDGLAKQFSLVKVGEAYHSFPGSGFTGVVCLTESHMSIHTWPEYGHATFDVFLSNFRQDNSEKVRAIYQTVLQVFGAEEINCQEIER